MKAAAVAGAQRRHLDPAAQGGADGGGVILQIADDAVLGGKGIRGQIIEGMARETVMPGRTVRNQTVPAFGPPAFGDAVAFQHQMRHALPRQMFGHGDTGLSAPDHKRIPSFHHLCPRCRHLSQG